MILIKNLLNLLRSYLDEYTHETAKLPNDFEDILGNSILFSTIWSIGASLDESCRRNFNDFLIRLITADSNVPSTFKIEF